MSVQIRVSGPVFGPGAAAIVEDAVRETIGDILARGEELVKEQLYPGHGLVTGHYRRSIRGERTDSQHGRIHDSNVIYGPWLEGVGSRNSSTRFRGYSMFRNARQQLDREAGRMLQHRIDQAVGRLN